MWKRKIIRGLTMTCALILAGIASKEMNQRDNLPAKQSKNSGGIEISAEQTFEHGIVESGNRETETEKEKTKESIQKQEPYPNLYTNAKLDLKDLPEKVIFLTFDDGPSKNTEKILDTLAKYDAKATFFLIGENLTDTGVKTAKRAMAEGHMLGLHTETHRYEKIYASADAFLQDYDLLAGRFQKEFAECPAIYRFPGGSYSCYINPIREKLKKELEERGFFGYDWDVSGEDAVGCPTAASIRKNIFDSIYAKEAPILLLHDSPGNCLTADLLPEILEKLTKEGYVFLTLQNRKPYQFPW